MAYRTAMARTKPSAPMRWLDAHGLLVGRMLDYGCGHGFDAAHYGMDMYDPHYFPQEPTGLYDTITCHYVLNVMKTDERQTVVDKVSRLLDVNGRAFFSVRRDLKKTGVTSVGTYQENVIIGLPTLFEKRGRYSIYVIDKSRSWSWKTRLAS